jgi:hypothetical protein
VEFIDLLIEDFEELKILSDFEKKYLKLLISDAIVSSLTDESLVDEAQNNLKNVNN